VWVFVIVYSVSLAYLALFLAGSFKKKSTRVEPSKKLLKISCILPIYREDSKIIKTCMESIVRQRGILVNLVAVVKDLKPEQIELIRSYSRRLGSVTVLVQKGKQSEIDAYKLGLRQIHTEYVCMLNADTTILNGSLSRLFTAVLAKKADVGFGLLYPQKVSKYSSFPAIDKIFRQLILNKGRGALEMGYYITGPFYIIRTRLLIENLRESLAYDFDLSLRLYCNRNTIVTYFPTCLATELEKASFRSMIIQYSRWTLGHISLNEDYKRFFIGAKTKIRVGVFGLIWFWYVMPLSLLLGLVLGVVFAQFNILLLGIVGFYYFVLTCILIEIKEIRSYKKEDIASFWLISAILRVCGMIMVPYTYYIRKYKREHAYRLYKRR
jgi:cellulose synthase/poly-beta-1,6-N-acetylglucosamine synthase-like glycosyltransferase